ncbi:general transcription factor IIIC subunit l(2)37Cd isoform X2 [Nomia melanderi]|uniref:general transcription factor IIIC subunit l(2)37Cd isoform X2 n=1 Tax=Nomia melanderi TaxID=2448451 RepID=UPI003FCED36A
MRPYIILTRIFGHVRMSESSNDSDEPYDPRDEKDEDFKIDDYRKDLGSDDSSADVPETNDDKTADEGAAVKQHEDDYIGPVLPGGHRFDKKFICIRYPGNVVNPDRAIETLGGIGAISTAVNTPNRRLELKFRPDDTYCKPTCGDRYNTKGFLLRVRVKKSRLKKVEETKVKRTEQNVDVTNVQSNEVQHNINAIQLSDTEDTEKHEKKSEEQVMSELADRVESCSVNALDDIADPEQSDPMKTEKNIPPTFEGNKYEDLSKDEEYELPKLKVLGRVDMEFKFTNLCDFQYLPMTQSKEDPKKLDYIYDKIYPSNIQRFSWLQNDVPYFLPPAAFSRMDTIQQYVPKTETNSYPENIIGKSTKRKAGFSNFIYFSTPEVPTKPPAGIETAMKVKFVQNTHFDQIRQLFEERPIWSKNAVMYRTKFSNDRLKILLPSVAYYFMTGPWKIMWVKLGYDPRKDITARKYQTLDYRLKAMHGLGSTVKCKRNYSEYTLPYRSTPVGKQKTVLSGVSTEQGYKKEQQLTENVYIYREGTVPPSRQMFYQYCDVLVEEIQEMLAKLPDPLPTARCHEKRGWLPSGFDAQCREIINKQVRAVLRKQMNIPDDYPTDIPKHKRKRGMKLKLNKLRGRKRKRKSEPGVEEGEEKSDEVKPSTSTAENE